MNTALQLVEKTKICKGCEMRKPLSEFARSTNNNDGYLGKCKSCKKPNDELKAYYSAYGKEWRAKLKENPVKYKEYLEKKNEWNRTPKYFEMYYKKRFGISYKEVLSMHAIQNGLCANIGCSKSITVPPMEGDRACVDHNHKTGKVRALLCVRCNAMLGHIENNMNLIPGFMDYLNKHQ